MGSSLAWKKYAGNSWIIWDLVILGFMVSSTLLCLDCINGVKGFALKEEMTQGF